MLHRLRWQHTVCAFAVVALMSAANSAPISKLKLDPESTVVPLFEGRDDGRFTVRLTAHNPQRATVVIANTTAEPLTVALPKAAVAVHVLPQFNLPNGPFTGNGTNQFGQPPTSSNGNGALSAMSNLTQNIGGPMTPTGFLNGLSNGQSTGFPSVPAEWLSDPQLAACAGFATIPAGQSIRLEMRTVCLNYGRKDPAPNLKYRLQSVNEYTTDAAVVELLNSYGARISPDAMQAAAWHVANGLTWEQLAALPQSKLLPGGPRLFAAQDLHAARELVERVR